MEGLGFPVPKGGWPPVLRFPVSMGTGARLDGELAEMSKPPPELELFCLVGQISSLGPGVSGVKRNRPAIDKSTVFPWVK